MPDEAVDNECDPCLDALSDADIWELFSFKSEEVKKNYHEAILIAQVNPDFLVVFFFLIV